jgi:NAD(P)-dependent dehydrogenase (short-subunit alcohol dehydrogenase family)
MARRRASSCCTRHRPEAPHEPRGQTDHPPLLRGGTASAAAAGAAVGASAEALTYGSRAAPSQVGRVSAGRFSDRVAIITGATSGIGRATAKAFAAEGAAVAFCGRRVELGQQVERELRAAGGEATYIPADVRVPEQVEAFVNGAVERYKRLDIAFNNAGIEFNKPLHEMTVDEWDEMLDTNARGVFLAMKYEIPHMLERGGVIVLTSSSGAERARPGHVGYTASKRAVQGIAKSAALDYGSRGIRVNALLPGTTDTPLVRPDGFPDAAWEDFKARWGPLNVDGLERMAEPGEIAAAVLALASDDLSYLTGASIAVDGGATAGNKARLP